MGAVKTVDQPLPLDSGRVSIKTAEGVTHSDAQVFKQIEGLGVVGHHDHPGGRDSLLVKLPNRITVCHQVVGFAQQSMMSKVASDTYAPV